MSRKRRGTATAATAVTAVALTAGCGASQARIDGASTAASSFAAAVQAGDSTAMCAVLAPETRQELERSEQTTCDQAVLEQQLPTTGPVEGADVHGRQAMVELAGDTLFLSQTATGWKVTAAGCTPRSGQPYQCRIKGG